MFNKFRILMFVSTIIFGFSGFPTASKGFEPGNLIGDRNSNTINQPVQRGNEERPPRYSDNFPQDLSSYKPIPLPEYSDVHGTLSMEEETKAVSYNLQTGAETITTNSHEFSQTHMEVPGSGGSDEFLPKNFSTLALVPNTTSWPYRTGVRMLFTSNGVGYWCSGSMIDPTHVLTAGHCSYYGGYWSENVFVIPGYDNGYMPYGYSNGITLTTWAGWVNNSLWDYDMSLISLDRPIGALTGWLGYGYHNDPNFFLAGSFIHNSYPGESPYDGEREYTQSGYYDSLQVSGGVFAGDQLTFNLRSYGGQSGSGAVKNDIVYASLSNGNSISTNDVRINSTKFGDFGSWISADYPSTYDLIPLDVNASPTTVTAGQTLSTLDFAVFNHSTSSWSGTVNFSVYLSSDDVISTSDTLLRSDSFTYSFSAKGYVRVNITTPPAIPTGLAPQDYYIGVILNISDYDTSNNYTDAQDVSLVSVSSGNQTVSVMDVFTTDQDGTAIKTDFRAGDTMLLWIEVNNEFPTAQQAYFEWIVLDPGGQDVPALEWKGNLTTDPGDLYWTLTATIPAVSPTGAYTFIGRITFPTVSGNTTSDTSSFNVHLQVQGQTTYLPLIIRAPSAPTYFEGPWEAEPNNSYLEANGPLRSNKDYYGYNNDLKDYFRINLANGGQIVIDLTNVTVNEVQLQLFYQIADVAHRKKSDTAAPYHIEYTGEPGTYYIYVYTEKNFNSSNPYTLRVTYP